MGAQTVDYGIFLRCHYFFAYTPSQMVTRACQQHRVIITAALFLLLLHSGPPLNRTRINQIIALTEQNCKSPPQYFRYKSYRINRKSVQPNYFRRSLGVRFNEVLLYSVHAFRLTPAGKGVNNHIILYLCLFVDGIRISEIYIIFVIHQKV